MIFHSLRLWRLLMSFVKNTYGCINKPYITCRKLADDKADIRQTVFIFLLVLGYFILASLLRTGIRNPYLLTLKFSSLFWTAVIGFAFMVVVLYVLGKIVGSKSSYKSLVILWAYSLLPTLTWFAVTSIFYIIFPPPRTASFLGKLYTLIYIAFSISILTWKLILYYLTLRFGLKLDLIKITAVSLIVLPLIIFYAVITYKIGIFRIPFI